MRLNRSFELKNELLAKVAASIAAYFAMQWLTAMNAHFPHVWGAQLSLAALFWWSRWPRRGLLLCLWVWCFAYASLCHLGLLPQAGHGRGTLLGVILLHMSLILLGPAELDRVRISYGNGRSTRKQVKIHEVSQLVYLSFLPYSIAHNKSCGWTQRGRSLQTYTAKGRDSGRMKDGIPARLCLYLSWIRGCWRLIRTEVTWFDLQWKKN